jgi:hypothetical protein
MFNNKLSKSKNQNEQKTFVYFNKSLKTKYKNIILNTSKLSRIYWLFMFKNKIEIIIMNTFKISLAYSIWFCFY